MNTTQLILRNLWFRRRQYFAVLAGVAISTAVLTGALIVGDSVRMSLERMTDIRLGKIRYSLQTSDRFFRQELAHELSAQINAPVVPVLYAGGIAINSEKNLRINQVQILGIDTRFRKFWDQQLPAPRTDEALVSRNVAEKLNLKKGDDLLLRIQKQGKAPSSAPFVAEKVPSASIRVKVSAIADDENIGRFSLKINQTAPYNIFLSLHQMASLLELSGYANLLLAEDTGTTGSMATTLDSALRICLEPADAGLKIANPVSATNPAIVANGTYEVTSDRIFFDNATANAVLTSIPGCQAILTYFVNSISSGTNSTPYSFVTAANESFLKQSIGQRQIIINDWMAKDLCVKAGDSVMLRYFVMGPLRSLREDSARFIVKSVISMDDELAEYALMPDFPGMSDAGNCRDWETGAPINLKKIRDKDEQYWKKYRGTPKAFISLSSGQQIWGNRFGNYTAFRFKCSKVDLPGIEKSLMLKISPAQCGLFFTPVYATGQAAAGNSTDFGELFLSLSFFILVSALLLTAMLFYLPAQMQMTETGILSAIGFRKRQILAILSGEAFIVTITGAIIGSFGGVLYNYFLILGLNTIWQDAVNTSILVMKVNPATLITGAAIGVSTSLAALFFILLKNLRKPLSIVMKGAEGIQREGYKKINQIIHVVIAVTCIGASSALLLWLLIRGNAAHGMLGLIAGGLLLPGGLALLNLLMIGISRKTWGSRIYLPGIPEFPQLTLKNLALRRSRTMFAVALLSLGTFTIIITGANRKTLYGNETTTHSGTGGFLLWAESVLPIMNDLNSEYGAGIFGMQDEEILKPVRFIQLPRVDGDDASCLNLNQVSKPNILGVPADLFDRLQSFNFTNLDSSIDPAHPWKALTSRLAPDVIPGFADQVVITWGLRKSVGDTLFYRDESGKILKIKLLGGLDNSIFQGNILVSDSLLRLYYPSTGGSRIMLVDGPVKNQDSVARKLEALFCDYGLMATPASKRLASFNAVENTYLSVFMLLGGLGVIIGTIGLGIVLLRNIAQRKKELALYVALGFQRQFVFKLILVEHTLILMSGFLLGLVASLPVIFPLLISPVTSVPWMFISAILLLILVNGFLWIYFPARKTLTREPLSGLRAE